MIIGMPFEVYSQGKKVAQWQDDHVEFVGEKSHGRFVKRVPLTHL